MKFSVVVAVLNRRQVIDRCLESVLAQTHPHVELIVIDGASADGTLAILQRYRQERPERFAHLSSQKDSGIYEALNRGVAQSTGDWVMVLGSDDLLRDSGVLARAAERIEGGQRDGRIGPQTSVVYGKAAMIAPEGSRRDGISSGAVCELEIRGRPWGEVRHQMRYSMPVPHPAVFHRREWLQRKRFDESYKIAADYKLLLSEFRNREPVFIDEVISCFALGGVSSDPRNSWTLSKEMCRASLEAGYALPNRRLIAALARSWLRQTAPFEWARRGIRSI